MKKLVLLLLIAVVFGCNNSSNVIAKVGKESISQEQFDAEVAKLTKAMVPADYVMTDDEKLQFESQILNNLIMKIVYTNEMDKRDIKVDEEQLKTQFDQLAAQYGSEEALIADIESKGFTFDEIKDEFRYQFRLQELNKLATEAEREVTEEEIQQFYNDNKETIFVIQPQVTASHILFNVDDVNPNLALEKAKQVRAEIIAGKDFAEAAKEYSQGPTGPNGGYLGTFGLGQMVKEFEMVAFAIPENEVSEPVLTQFGYHLILVESRTDKSYAPYEETKSYISQKIKVDGFFKDIENSVKITKPDWLTL